MSDVTIPPIQRPFAATITPPGSKSLTNRALVLAALARGTTRLQNALLADDTRVMLDGLQRLGFEISIDEPAAAISITGRRGTIPAKSAELFCGNSGTTIRFLTALCGLGTGEYKLDGTARMRERPIGELVQMLRNLGVRTTSLEKHGFPPVLVEGHGLPGGILRVGVTQSSQFLSAILMIAPYARHEVRIDLEGPQTSWPYTAMTMRQMDAFGVTPELYRDPATHEPRQIIIPAGVYHAIQETIEPDASNAAYFLAAAAIHPGSRVTVRGLGTRSIQGDIGFAGLLRRMGAKVELGADSIAVTGPEELGGIDADLSAMPDTAQTLAVVALFAAEPTVLRGLGTLRVKETDRLAALSAELTAVGAEVSIDGDDLTIDPPDRCRAASIRTYDDHRMAMSFALAASRCPQIVITGAECVSKTYPRFFDDFSRVLEGKE